MIQFSEDELSKLEDELYQTIDHLEEIPEYEAEGSVNLLRVGQKTGQALQILKRVNDLIGDKLREAKTKTASRDSIQKEIDSNIRKALDKHKSLFQRDSAGFSVKHSKARPMPYVDSPWDENEEELPHGSRD